MLCQSKYLNSPNYQTISMKLYFYIITLCCVSTAVGQFNPLNGVKESKPVYYALKNATIYISPDKIIKNGTLLIKGDKVEKYGLMVSIPKDAVEIDCSDKVIFPSFIELNTDVGLPKLEKKSRDEQPQIDSEKNGAGYWNEAIHPEVDASTLYKTDTKANKELIEKGFGFALSRQKDGIAQGYGTFVSLGASEFNTLKLTKEMSFYSFTKGVSRQSYPSSQMGSIALLRQAFFDATYYATHAERENNALKALNEQKDGKLFFQTRDKLEIQRAHKIAEEFNLQFVYLGSGNEYDIISDLKVKKPTIVIPIDFPEAYDVKNPYISRQIPLSQLKHWELAPMNASILAQNKVPFCISSDGTKTTADFWANLRKAIELGLTESDALKALTVNPANAAGFSNELGTLEENKFASFVIYSKNPLKEKAELLEYWSMGEQTVLKVASPESVAGKYNLLINNKKFKIDISGEPEKYKGKITYPTTAAEVIKDSTTTLFVDQQSNDITFQFNIIDSSWNGSLTLQGKANIKLGIFEGDGLLPNGKWVKWSAIKIEKAKSDKEVEKPVIADTVKHLWFPNMAFGMDSIAKQENILIKNATIWTNEKEGIIQNGSIVIQNGKITHVGQGALKTPPNARIIDANGKYVTSGIIDEHSHIAISKGVNEGGQAISAEVSIRDVINPNDIDIYRQLAGGVTIAQLLHGSANPIGGQSAIIKLKWGETAENLLIEDQPLFIKFALGENVKQSNWGDYNTIRFPQTRMGVEQLYYDAFARAKEYAKNKKSSPNKYQVDLELETLVEILEGKRHITCHSYVQSEINMLMHVADSMGFKINTFTHILEGYKVADKMKEHGAGGSTFSDWWAYKYEVNDAIPYNAAIMHKQGVIVAINSDDAEMGRRLNQEAAKSVKYGKVSEMEAWKMVTLNPAKILHIDDRTGSLKVGKDADIVVWSANPLSINAIVEQTIVDGTIYYDKEMDLKLQQKNQEEKARIISKMLDANSTVDAKTQPFFKRKRGHYHCNTLGEELSTEENHH